jgi:uncharacterized protein (DUF362 family)
MKVSVIKCEDYCKVKSAIKHSVDLLGGFQKYVKEGSTVLLKPNLGSCRPLDSGFVTHPQFIKAVAELVKEAGGKILIGDIAAGADGDACKFKEVAEQTSSQVIDLTKEGFVVKNIPDYYVVDRIGLTEKIFEVGCVINLPKLKTHGITFLTGAVKNLFGCVEPQLRLLLHLRFNTLDFNRALADIYSVIKPRITLNIMDAIDAIEGGFALKGNKKRVGLVLSSEDAVCLDVVSAAITGHNPSELPLINYASKNDPAYNIKNIEILGESLAGVVVKDFKKNEALTKGRTLKLNINKEKCAACGRCIKSCPVGAIKDYEIDNNICIRCFCCEEVCPNGAIRFLSK